MDFKELKNSVLEGALSSGSPCIESVKGLRNSASVKDLVSVGREHFKESCIRRVLTPELVRDYAAEFKSEHITANKNATDSYVLVTDESEVTVNGNSYVIALDNAHVEVYDNTIVEAYGNATVKAFDTTRVIAHENSTVEGRDFACITALDNSQVKAEMDSYVIARSSAKVETIDSAILKIKDY